MIAFMTDTQHHSGGSIATEEVSMQPALCVHRLTQAGADGKAFAGVGHEGAGGQEGGGAGAGRERRGHHRGLQGGPRAGDHHPQAHLRGLLPIRPILHQPPAPLRAPRKRPGLIRM